VKTITRAILVAGTVLLASATRSLAIEGLQLSVQCPDVVLGWPSAPGENYIVQWRPTLDPSTPWVTLTNSLPADWTTNWTIFVHSNQVQCASGATNNVIGGGDGPPPTPNLAVRATSTSQVSEPLVRPVDGSGSPVPLCLYPPGFDLSGFVILDPSTGQWVSGSGYTRRQPSLNRLQPDDPQPQDDDPGNGGSPADPGFYQVVMDGVKISGSSISNLTSGVLSGTIPVLFEAGNASGDGTGTNLLGTIDNATITVDFVKFPGDGVLGPPWESSPWQFSLDTRYLQNGDHTVQIEVTWKNPDSSDNNNPYFDRYSDFVSITVSNNISYPNWEPEIGETDISAYFLQTTCTDADWHIDIYDVNSNLVQTLTGHTPDGNIEAYWNMIDIKGVARTNADVDPEFSSIVTVADPFSASTPKKKQRRKDWPDHGVWTVAYQDFFKFEYDPNNYMKGSIDAFANTAAKYGGYYLYYPPAGSTNDIGQTYPLRYQKTNHMDTNITYLATIMDEALLEIFLMNTNSRNFYYNGHGNAAGIAEGLEASELNSLIKHRYRFVFLDGCETANGHLDQAFGINGPGVFALPYYQSTGIRPGAFCGYNCLTYYATGGPKTVNGVTYDDTIQQDAPFFIYNFLFYWDTDLEGQRLADAVYNAALPLFPIGRSGWTPGDGLQIYGFNDLRIDDYNHKLDWP
jgi:hypothetical protein